MNQPNPRARLMEAAAQMRQSLERLRDSAAMTTLAMQEFAMAADDDLKESLDDAARCLIGRASCRRAPDAP